MTRLPELDTDTADTDQRALLVEVERQLGKVPNLYAAMANGPATLRGYLALRDALVRGELSARSRELLALFIAQHNNCAYCVAAHTLRGERMRIPAGDLRMARRAESADPHTRAVLQLARVVMLTGGRVADEELAEIRAAGVTDAQLAEVVAHVALNTLSNYFNHLAQPHLDFPAVELSTADTAGT